MNIKIGLLAEDAGGWMMILEQEGVPYSLLSGDSPHMGFSALIASDDSGDFAGPIVREYLSGGGALLCSGKFFSRISGHSTKRKFIRYIIGEPGSKIGNFGMLDIGAAGFVPANANSLQINGEKPGAFCGEYNGGYIIVLPFDPGEVVLDQRRSPKSFYSEQRRLPYEEVSRVAKGSLIRLVSGSLELLHHERGLPYIHKWYFPEDHPTIFGWRIDTDYSEMNEILRLYGLINDFKIPATWFIDVRSQGNFLPLFREMEGQEIGIHCYRHKKYKDINENFLDIKRGIEILRRGGLNPRGFAAPFGIWNGKLALSLNQLTFDYSSEFSYDYDNIPSFPVVNKKPLAALQVPVHPICIGSLKRQGYEEEEMCRYFDRVQKGIVSNRMPMILYHHPGNRNENVVKQIFEFVGLHRTRSMKLIEYATWWKRRSRLRCECWLENRKLDVRPSLRDDEIWQHMTLPGGNETWFPSEPVEDIDSLAWRIKIPPPRLPEDIRRIRNFNPWILIQRVEDHTIGNLKRL